MKKIITIIAIFLFTLNAKAQSYYISSSDINANDTCAGTVSAPWKSFVPLNVLLSGSSNVDTIFLKCGDIFREQIYDSLKSNLVITSFGTGNKPVISGAYVVSSWDTVTNQSYYKASFAYPVVNFFVNDKEQILARTPNEGVYYSIKTGATDTSLRSNSLSNAAINSMVCLHTKEWCWEKATINSSSGNQIFYSPATSDTPSVNYKFFLYDNMDFLDTLNEWKYNALTQKIYYKPASANPNTLLCEASVLPYGIRLGMGVEKITILNIAFEKQADAGVGVLNAANKNIIIDNCFFARQYKYGIDMKGKRSEIKSCNFREVDGIAVYIHGTAARDTIHHNTFRNNGGFRNSGIGTQINLSSIKGAFIDSCHIHHNNIDSAGYCGIAMDGTYNLIERNIVKNAMLLNNDGAALKTFGYYSQYNIYRNNFVSKSDGNTEGTAQNETHFMTPAIYFDFSTNNCTIQENTFYDRNNKGIFFNAGNFKNSAIGNVVYGGNILMDFNGFPHATITTDMTEMTIKHNTFFAKDSTAFLFRLFDNTNDTFTGDDIDSNYYFQPYSSSHFMLMAPSTTVDTTLAEWQQYSGFDLHSKSSFVSWTYPTSYDTLIMNQTDNIVTVNLGTTKYLDLDSNDVCGSITLHPYTSKILINTNTFCSSANISDKKNNNSVSVFPNPGSSEIVIKSTNKSEKVSYIISNQLGQILLEGYLVNGTDRVSIANINSGLYFIQIMGNEIQTIKFIKN